MILYDKNWTPLNKLSMAWSKLESMEQFYVLYFKCETLNVIDLTVKNFLYP